jgi:hypothetical protein
LTILSCSLWSKGDTVTEYTCSDGAYHSLFFQKVTAIKRLLSLSCSTLLLNAKSLRPSLGVRNEVKQPRITKYLQLYSHLVGHWPLFQFFDPIHSRKVSFDEGSAPSQGRYLRTEQHRHRINAHKYPCLEWDSNQQPQFPSEGNNSCLRQRSHCDRYQEIQRHKDTSFQSYDRAKGKEVKH